MKKRPVSHWHCVHKTIRPTKQPVEILAAGLQGGGHFVQASTYRYNDVIMCAVASQIISLRIVYSTVDSDADWRKHQSSASLAFVRGIHRGPVNSPHKWPVTRKMFPFDDVIMSREISYGLQWRDGRVRASQIPDTTIVCPITCLG